MTEEPEAFRDSRYMAEISNRMQVPDRILVAGRDQHINAAKKSTPFEMQVENAVMPPTRLEVRVNTPPRNIRLDDHNFPNAQSEDDLEDTIEGDDSLNETQENNSRPSSGNVSFRKHLA